MLVHHGPSAQLHTRVAHALHARLISHRGMLRHAVCAAPCCAMLYRAMLRRAMLRRAVLYRAVL
jgi:hypothetical protein|eukprot:4730182-Prymnesium_polylepis.1